MSNHAIFTCECCGSDYLINFQDRSFEPLWEEDETISEVSPPLDLYDEQIEFDDEVITHELDLDEDLETDEITAEPEPGYSNIARNQKSYSDGTPVVYGVDVETGGKTVRQNTPPTNQKSGIRVETQMGSKNPQPRVRQQKRTKSMEPATAMKGVVRPPSKNAQPSREGFESYGSDASQDFTGLTGADAHFDNLLQSAYEADLQSRNIPY